MYEDFEEALKAIGYKDENFSKDAEGYYGSNGLDTLFEGWKLCKKFYGFTSVRVVHDETPYVVDASGNRIMDFFKRVIK